ncbi:hypothetical protein [Serratia ureilytica]|uniref:hypothetical protein n=1 Tax=Serratia ureilytica TaxID=300181 RepID=UPI0018E8AEB7|nr:hypothetical protein [Serratia ureilytica]MBJ2082137.1 hypothetical protein [Serratia ureilytica]
MHMLNGFDGLFHLHEPTTPTIMSANVSRLLKKIFPTSSVSGSYFRLTLPKSFSPLAGECYYNVAKMIRDNGGGEPVLGWMIWESSTLIEGEAHCLYKSSEGEILDITPRVSGEETIFFVPDSRVHPSLEHISGTKFKMYQNTNPKLANNYERFEPSQRVELDFDQSEIRVIKLVDYQDSFLFEK